MMSDRDRAAGPDVENRKLRCREVVELVTAYLDDVLDADDRRLMERHLAACDDCSTYLEQMRQTIAALHAHDVDGLNPETKDLLLQRFRRWRVSHDG
jgi:anti-sigma factor RsiW